MKTWSYERGGRINGEGLNYGYCIFNSAINQPFLYLTTLQLQCIDNEKPSTVEARHTTTPLIK